MYTAAVNPAIAIPAADDSSAYAGLSERRDDRKYPPIQVTYYDVAGEEDLRRARSYESLSTLATPIPTDEMEELISAAWQLPAAQKNKRIVLDLDETHVHTMEDPNWIRHTKILTDTSLAHLRHRLYCLVVDLIEPRGVGVRAEMWGTTRPHMEKFLRFCQVYFQQVDVWSAGKKHYVYAVCNTLFPGTLLTSIYTYDDCVHSVEGYLIKPLAKIGCDLSKTLMLDDRSTVCIENPHNGIKVPPYNAETVEQIRRDDHMFLELMRWLMSAEVLAASDVRSLKKDGIFST